MTDIPISTPSPTQPPKLSRLAASAPPVQRALYPHTSPSLISPVPRRRGGIIIAESALDRPVLGSSPVAEADKGKAPVTKCKEMDPYVADYDSDDSDEDSFQRALNAIQNMGRDIGSSSQVHPTPPVSSHPPAGNAPPHNSTSHMTSLSLEIVDVPHSPSALPLDGSPPLSPTNPVTSPPSDDDSELIQDIMDRVVDTEPLMARTKRLQAQKEKSTKKSKPDKKKPPPTV